MDFLKKEIERKKAAKAKAKAEAESKAESELEPKADAEKKKAGAESDGAAAAADAAVVASPPLAKKKYLSNKERKLLSENGGASRAKQQADKAAADKAAAAAAAPANGGGEDEGSKSSRTADATTPGSTAPNGDGLGDDKEVEDGMVDAEISALSAAEVVKRLRGLGQPKALFGEDDPARRRRLYKVALSETDNVLEHAAKTDMRHAQRGDQFLRDIEAMQEERDQLKKKRLRETDELGKRGRGGGGGGGGGDDGGMNSRADDDEKSSKRDRADNETLSKEDDFKSRVEAAAAAAKIIAAETTGALEDCMLAYWQRLLREWGEELDGQMSELQNSVEGMQRLASFKQTKEYLRPLFDRLKARTVPLEMMKLLEELFHLMRHRKYLEAVDRYVQISIGNAPWPIGVTRVGIHERSAREKLQEGKKTLSANIMTDETTRKYLVCVKRLITFAQRKYPTDPSNSCEFNSLANGSDLETLTGRTNHLRDDIQLPALQDFRDVSVRMWTN